MTQEELDKLPQYGISELALPGVRFFQTREQYKSITGKEPTPYVYHLPNKHWDVSSVPSRNYFSYFIITKDKEDNPVQFMITSGIKFLQSVNIPQGQANAEEMYNLVNEPFPVRQLLPHERLELTFGGIIVVKNSKIFDPFWGKLDIIISKLDELLKR